MALNIATGSFDAAARVIEDHWLETVNRGQMTTVGDWLEALPIHHVESDPTLAIISAWIHLNNNDQIRLDRALACAQRSATADPLPSGISIPGSVALIRAHQDRHAGRVMSSLEHALEAADAPTAQLLTQHAAVLAALGVARFWADDPEAINALEQAVSIGRNADEHVSANQAAGHLCLAHAFNGQTAEAADKATETINEISRLGLDRLCPGGISAPDTWSPRVV